MLCISGLCPCKLALSPEGNDQEVAGTQMVIAWEARAAQRSGGGLKSNELAAEREGCLSSRKRFNNRGTASLDSDHWDIYIEAYGTTI